MNRKIIFYIKYKEYFLVKVLFMYTAIRLLNKKRQRMFFLSIEHTNIVHKKYSPIRGIFYEQ